MSVTTANNTTYQVCTRCIIDTTVPGVNYDSDGVCNFCHLQDKMEKEFPVGEEGKKSWEYKLGKENRSITCLVPKDALGVIITCV